MGYIEDFPVIADSDFILNRFFYFAESGVAVVAGAAVFVSAEGKLGT